MVGRLLGWLLIVAALATAAIESAVLVLTETAGTVSAYATWDHVHPLSLRLVRAALKQNVHPALWDPVLVTLLRVPAWLLLGAPGIALVWLFRRRTPPSREDELAAMMRSRPDPEPPEVYLNLDELRALAAKEDAPIEPPGEPPPHKVVPFAGPELPEEREGREERATRERD
ncbi:MAG: hypothetical protein HY521_05910 [Proteobacteria bacterium]|nr:hypothetical protein [Pseudomonadota bacterium]